MVLSVQNAMLTPLINTSIGTDCMNGSLEGLSTAGPPLVMILGTVTLEGLTIDLTPKLQFSMDKTIEGVTYIYSNDLSPYPI